MKLLVKAGAIFDRVITILMGLACGVFAFVVLLIGIDVVMRYGLSHALPWTLEISELALVVITGLGVAWLLKEEGHVKVEILLNRLKPRHQDLLNAITSAFGAMALAIISWYGIQVTSDYFQRGIVEQGAIGYPRGLAFSFLLVGCLLFLIQFVRRSYSHLKSCPKER